MEPVAFLGTADAVASIISVICKTISTLKDLHDKWKDADLTILNLVSQLSSLKAALGKIAEWIASDLADLPQHHQLVMDLENSITCCKMLLGSMDVQLSKLDWNAESHLDLGSRIRVVFEDKASRDFQTFVARQTSALTLLLVACNCKTISEQYRLLEWPSNRQVFDQVKDDSSSLLVLRDVDSCFSGQTNSTASSSLLSRVFPFDAELMRSGVYQRTVRSLLKRAIRRGKAEGVRSTPSRSTTHTTNIRREKTDQAVKSRAIDASIHLDRMRMRNEFTMLMFGSHDSGKDAILRTMKRAWLENYSQMELPLFREKIVAYVAESMINAFRYMEEVGPELEDEWATYIKITPLEEMTADLLTPALPRLWGIINTRINLDEIEHLLRAPSSAYYFFQHIDRIAEADYMPSQEDIRHIPDTNPWLSETLLSTGDLDIRVVEYSGSHPERKKWFHQFENVFAVMYVVDISAYDQSEAEAPYSSRLEQSLMLFESIANSVWFSRAGTILLILNNADLFQAKLASNPLSNYFRDYYGGPGLSDAKAYIVERFRESIRWPIDLQWYFTCSTDAMLCRFVSGSITGAIILKT